MKLSDSEFELYSRQIVLNGLGLDGQARLKQTRVLVAGCGGLGTAVAQHLAGMGFGYIKLVDYDIVSTPDLHRQSLFKMDDRGKPKVEVAGEFLSRRNPHIQIDAFAGPIDEETAYDLLKSIDLVVDGLDNAGTRYILNRTAWKLGKPYIFGSALTYTGMVSTIMSDDGGACLECFAGNLSDDELPTCATAGILPPVLGIVGSIEAAEAVRLALGMAPLLREKVLVVDLQNLLFTQVRIKKNPDCSFCSSRVEQVTEPKDISVNITCGREGNAVVILRKRGMNDLDLDGVAEVAGEYGITLTNRTKLSARFQSRDGWAISFLKGGVAVAEAPVRKFPLKEFENKALNTYLAVLEKQ